MYPNRNVPDFSFWIRPLDRNIIRAISFALMGLLWVGLAQLIADPSVLPTPLAVGYNIVHEWQNDRLLYSLLATGFRVVLAFILAMLLGGLLGYWMGSHSQINQWLDPWLLVCLNMPALVIIVLCYLWIGLNETAAVLAVTLNKVPMVATIIREGVRARNPKLQDLVQVYRVSTWNKLRCITLPELVPAIMAAARSGLAVIWKIVLVVEFLGRSNGVGYQIHLQFQQFNVGMVLAYALSFVFLIVTIEFIALQPLERQINRWRHP